jgi:hypothetical protein
VWHPTWDQNESAFRSVNPFFPNKNAHSSLDDIPSVVFIVGPFVFGSSHHSEIE